MAAVSAWTLLALLAPGPVAAAMNAHILRPPAEIEQELTLAPMRIVSAMVSRPQIKSDVTLRAEASFSGGPPYRIKLRRAEPGAEVFNNRPRYDLAAYQLQKLFLDPAEYVVPPTMLRMVPLAELQPWLPGTTATFRGSDDVLVVLQYWLQDVTNASDVYDGERFVADRVYARHVGQLNILTYLIAHGDSNTGNFLISKAYEGAFVFAVDNNVAFGSEEGDRGELWRRIRVKELPADTIERLRTITKAELQSRLEVLAQWQLREGHYLPVTPGRALARHDGVRFKGDVVQLGLTAREIYLVWSRVQHLLKDVKHGDIKTF